MKHNKKVYASFLIMALLFNVFAVTVSASGAHRDSLVFSGTMVENQVVLKALVIIAAVVGVALLCSMISWKNKTR